MFELVLMVMSAIHQYYSWSTLNLTGPMLFRLAKEHNVMPEFSKMLRVFRWKLRNVDASYVAPFQSRVSEEQIRKRPNSVCIHDGQSLTK